MKLIGREEPLAILNRCFSSIIESGGRVILIIGEAGIGKTTLVEGFLNSLPREECFVTKAKCASNRSEPYMPFLEAFEYLSKVRGKDSCKKRDKKIYKALRNIGLASLEELPGGKMLRAVIEEGVKLHEKPDFIKEKLFSQIRVLIKNLSQKKPLVIFIDDLHWADPDSIELFFFISQYITDYHCLLICTLREKEVIESCENEAHRYYSERIINRMLRSRIANSEIIHLKPLSREQMTFLASSTLGVNHLPDEIINYLYTKCEGNPYFLEVFIKQMVAEQMIEVKQGVCHVALGFGSREHDIPESLKSLVGHRLTGLSKQELRFLQRASILGKCFDCTLLLCLMGIDRESFLETIDCLCRKEIIIDENEGNDFLCFDHDITREHIYSSISFHKRKYLHEAAAKCIEKISENDSHEGLLFSLAYHYERAGIYERAFYSYKDLGMLYFSCGSPSSSISYLEKALELSEKHDLNIDAESLLDIHLQLARSKIMILNYSEAENHLSIVEEMANTATNDDSLIEMYSLKGLIASRVGKWEKVKEINTELMMIAKAAGKIEAEKRAKMNTLKWHSMLGVDLEELHCLIEELYQEGLEDIWAESLFNYAIAFSLRTGKFNEAINMIKEARRKWNEKNTMHKLGMADNNIGYILTLDRQYDKANEFFNNAYIKAKNAGDSFGVATACLNQGLSLSLLGEHELGISYTRESINYQHLDTEYIGRQFSLGYANSLLLTMETNNIEHAKKIYNQILQDTDCLPKETKDRITLELIQIYNNMGIAMLLTDSTSKCLNNFSKALSLYESIRYCAKGISWLPILKTNILLAESQCKGHYESIPIANHMEDLCCSDNVKERCAKSLESIGSSIEKRLIPLIHFKPRIF